MKVIINKCYGGFSISERALMKLRELGQQGALDEVAVGESYDDGEIRTIIMDSVSYFVHNIPRNDPLLVEVVEEMGEEANGGCAELLVVEVPEDIEWEIEEYDGIEWVAEKHRTWS